MWKESGITKKKGIEAVREFLLTKKVDYTLLVEENNNEVSASIQGDGHMDLKSYKVENNRIYEYQE